ncbi:ABC transporter ATP-binding protein [Caldicoprobacter algeriensis]|uniref:ABC transporter ATP-binding protein n=1 Tax=Caldicoprobacter algeriensis TaxID=699281 RepID=UPI00207AABA0|nr:ABC transporter ATP-binding protein [Caldicoprobacter algeriensis]MCM8899738.1 ABC transporter ATP-binding protein [Caldicoprobacter algeriensis]
MLVVRDLVKKYGDFLAVDHLNMEVERGQIFGFIGPNGAGKTTTMKIIATLLAPTSGRVVVDGIDVFKDPIKAREKIGYMPDFFGVYDNLKVKEYLDFYGSAYGIEYRERRKIAEDLLELVDLSDKKDAYVDTLSRGMKQRLCLARCLIHNPELLILDEPASGMDPRARAEIKAILKELKRMGKTILISSHILPEVAEICDSVGIIDRGKLVVQGSVEQIIQRMTGRTVVRIRVLRDMDRAISLLKEQPMVTSVIQEDQELEVACKGSDEDLWQLLRALVSSDVPVVSFRKMEGNLEQIFMEVTSDEEMAL